MKKFLTLALVAMFAFVACQKDNNKEDDKNKTPEVKTCAENLVLHMPFEAADNAVKVGEGFTFAEKKGAADFGTGYIGNGYVNTKANNDEAYFKFNLAKNNALTKLESITFTVWVKNNEEFQKGCLFSVNGRHFGTQDWPSLVTMFDNKGTEKDADGNDTGVKTQQVNGRFLFPAVAEDGSQTTVDPWLDTWNAAFAKYGTWFQYAFTYDAATGAWALYVDGVKIKDAEFGPKNPVKECFASDLNAFYVGGWASWIEKFNGAADWMSFFSGSIDELRIYNKALTEAEIQALRKEEVAIALL